MGSTALPNSMRRTTITKEEWRDISTACWEKEQYLERRTQPKFTPTKNQIKYLSNLSDSEKEREFAKLEQAYIEPFVIKQKMKENIRETWKNQRKRKRKNTETGCLLKKREWNAWGAEWREKIRNKAQSVYLKKAAEEEFNTETSQTLGVVLEATGWCFTSIGHVFFLQESYNSRANLLVNLKELQEMRQTLVENVFNWSEALKRTAPFDTAPYPKKFKENSSSEGLSEESEESEESDQAEPEY